MGTGDLAREWRVRSVRLSTRCHPLVRLRMNGAVLLRPYTSSQRSCEQICFHLFFRSFQFMLFPKGKGSIKYRNDKFIKKRIGVYCIRRIISDIVVCMRRLRVSYNDNADSCRSVWSNGAMIVTRENWSIVRKTLYSVDGRWMNMEQWWNDTDRGNWSTGRKIL